MVRTRLPLRVQSLRLPLATLSTFVLLLALAPAAQSSGLRLALLRTVNKPPVISGTPVTAATVGNAWGFQPTASDPEGRTLKFTCSGRPVWATFDSRTGRLAGTPTLTGTTASIRITASDGKKTASLPAFTITVTQPAPANAAPTIAGAPATSIVAGQNYAFAPTAADANGDALTFTVTGKPVWATFSAATGTLSGVPASAAIGTYAGIVISVSDGKVSTALPAFTITVTAPPNHAPTISGTPPAAATVGQPYAFRPTAADVDGDPLAFGVANKPAWATFDVDSGTLYGTPSLANVGTQANVVISVSDGHASATLAPFSITVNRGATASVTLNWTAPTQNTDGSALCDLAGYRIFYGTSSRSYAFSMTVTGAGTATAVIEGLAPGTYYFAIQSVNAVGVTSDYSGEVTTTI